MTQIFRFSGALALALGLFAAAPHMAQAQDWEALEPEVIDEILGSVTTDFYHEMGHALVYELSIPVLGAEEDAADALSVFMINEFWEEDAAVQIMRASLATWATMVEEDMSEFDFYDEHAPSAKRLATMSCMFYGANPEARVEFAEEIGIPEERYPDCEYQFFSMHESWGQYFDELTAAGEGESLIFEEPEEETPLTEQIRGEVDYLNSIMTLPTPLLVSVESCGQANAYFSSSEEKLVICTELADQVIARM